jgi:hypothetical protein
MFTSIVEATARSRVQNVPHGFAADQDYQSAAETLSLLTRKAEDVRTAITTLETHLFESQLRAPVVEGADVATALAVAIGGRLPPPNDDVRAEHSERRRELDALLKGSTQQRATLDAIADRLNREHCATLRPRLVAIAKRKLAALAEIDAADDDEGALRREIADAGYDSSALPSLTLPAIGRSDDANGSAAYYAKSELRAFIGQH